MFEILLKSSISFDKVFIRVNSCRVLSYSDEIVELIDNVWEAALKQAKNENRRIWNGESLRLDDWEYNDDALILDVSPVNFKDRFCREKLHDEMVLQGRNFIGAGLAIGTLLQTCDGYYIFGILGDSTMNFSKISLIGGIVDDCNMTEGRALEQELIREIQEETGIVRSLISESNIIGLIKGNKGSRVILCHTLLDIDKLQCQHLFEEGSDHEMDRLIYIEKAKLKSFLEQGEKMLPIVSNFIDN